jgi:hypothetical protein
MKVRYWLALSLFATAHPLAAQEQVSSGSGAVLRALDKVSGTTTDIEIRSGDEGRYGRLIIALKDCRYPVGNPAGNAYAQLIVTDLDRKAQVFSGWMIASAPALSALDHRRYDVWVMRCMTS